MLVGLLGAASLVGCTQDPQSTSSTVREIQEVRRRTVPINGQLTRTTQPVQSGFAIRAEWEIQTGSSDNQMYYRWLKNQLGPEYHVTTETASTITFVKGLDGDSYDLEISGKPAPSGVVAEAKFVARPD